MTQSKKPIRPIEPERPSPMMETERPISLKEAISILTPRWLKRSSRRGRPS